MGRWERTDSIPLRRGVAWLAQIALCLAAWALPLRASGQEVFRDSFERGDVTWRFLDRPTVARVDAHQQIDNDRRSGLWSEYLRLILTGTGPARLEYELEPARVIDELAGSIWVRSDRSGVQLMARVLLSRSVNPATGEPLEILVPGTTYTSTGNWQQLWVERFSTTIDRQVRLLRAEHGSQVDPKEAVIAGLLLVVPPPAATVQLMIDDLELRGYLPQQGGAAIARPNRPLQAADNDALRTAEPTRQGPDIRITGSSISVEGRPIFPRAVVHRGESLEFLRRLGFNVVVLATPPAADVAAEGERLGLWFISPPPAEADRPDDGTDTSDVGPRYDRVLAWNLGRRLTTREIDFARQQSNWLRAHDREVSRPILCEARNDLRAFAQVADVLLLDRPTIGSSIDLTHYVNWMVERPRMARARTVIWATVPTQPAPEIIEQARLLGGPQGGVPTVTHEQIRLATFASLAGGAKGLWFESATRLDAGDPATQLRAAALEVLNLELSLVEPWMAKAGLVSSVAGSEPGVWAAMLESDHSRLLLPLWLGSSAQLVPGQSAGNSVSFIVPGVPEAIDVLEVGIGSMPLPVHRRVTGGTRILLGEFGLTSVVALTQDDVAISYLNKRLGEISQRGAELERRLVASRLEAVTATDRALTSAGHIVPRSAEWLDLARQGLATGDARLATRDPRTAFLEFQRAGRPLRMLERAHWEQAIKPLASPLASPLATSFSTLPGHYALLANLSRTQFMPADIYGGEFEDLNTAQQAGWRRVEHAERGVKTIAELSKIDPHSGRFSLRLSAVPSDPENPPSGVETPAVWINSPPLRVNPGELVRITGFVRIDKPIRGIDGLMVLDSLTGAALAERFVKTKGWQPIELYRAATGSGEMMLTIALGGLGEAFIDDFRVERIMRPRDLPRGQAQYPPPRRPPPRDPFGPEYGPPTGPQGLPPAAPTATGISRPLPAAPPYR